VLILGFALAVGLFLAVIGASMLCVSVLRRRRSLRRLSASSTASASASAATAVGPVARPTTTRHHSSSDNQEDVCHVAASSSASTLTGMKADGRFKLHYYSSVKANIESSPVWDMFYIFNEIYANI